MNEPVAESGNPRWWLDPAIARLAFGASARDAPAGAGGDSRAQFGIDLDDPEQRAFGEFELLELIGQGGMGVVYRARQTRLQREVAVKLLSAGPWASPDFVVRFQQEARHAAQLQHPAIVTIFELGEVDGLVHYAMELVRGQSLAQRLDASGPWPARDAAMLIRAAAEAVDYAHSLGVVHLDLKPGNVLLDSDGHPKIADFGLARHFEQAGHLDNDRVSGTPSYMAPEQAGIGIGELGPATDVWGLGAILYELLTGRPPFEAGDALATLQLVRTGDVTRPGRLQPLPADLEAVCMKCLAKQPAQRYPGARNLADDLGRFLDGHSVQARPLNAMQRMVHGAKREPKFAIASALAVMALLAGLLATTQQWRRADHSAMTASERLWESRREAALRLEEEGNGWDALPRLLQNVTEQAQAGRDEEVALDRQRIGLLLGQGATLIDAIAIADANPLAVALSDDGSRLAIAFNDQSVRWYDTATLDELGRISLGGRISSSGQTRSIMLLRFIGNDRLLATLEWYHNYVSPTDGDTWMLDLTGKTVLEPPPQFEQFADANYSRDGRLALVRNRDGRAQLWQVAPWSPLSAPTSSPSAATPWLIAPGARHAMALDSAMRQLQLYALPALRHTRTLAFPQDAGISAWAASPNGRRLAFGDLEGRIFLLSPDTGSLRTLPSARGREITWLSFSEDGGWLATGSADGRVNAWDVESGDPLVSGSMLHDFAVRRVGISRARRLLIATGEGRMAVWRLPAATGPRALPAFRVGAAPAAHDQAGLYAIDWSMQSGLLASAGIDGQVRLWRLPPSPIASFTTARQSQERLQFDGAHMVDVEWNRLRLVSPSGRGNSAWLTLAQPPGYAELTDNGRTLVVTVGPQLRIYDARSLRLRVAPVALGNTPQRLLISPDGRRVLLDFGTVHASGFGDWLQLYDLETGRQLPGEVVLPGPSLALTFSPDAQRIISIGPAHASTTVLSAEPLRVIGEYPHDPFQPVIGADFSTDGTVLLVTRADDPRLGTDELLIWAPATDVIRARFSTGRTRPYGVIALPGGGAFVPGETDILVYDGVQFRRAPRARTALDSSMGEFAVSPDRRLVALASRHAVQLYTASGVQLGAPLRLDTPPSAGIVDLAFSSDGDSLLARTAGYAYWRIAPERRGSGELDALLARMRTHTDDPQRLVMPSARQRAALRASDSVPWPTLEPRPSPVIAGHGAFDRSPIPARAADTPATALDLTGFYTVGPDSVRNSASSIRPFLRPYPAGLQRIGGIDFDLRGMLEIDPGGLPQCIPIPEDGRVAALHALLLPVVRSREAKPRLLAELILHYRDGGRARLPIRTGREVQGYAGYDESVPLAFSPKPARAAMAFNVETLAAPRLVNPQPDRILRCVDLRTTGDPMLVLGLTVEPAEPRPTTATSSRNTRM